MRKIFIFILILTVFLTPNYAFGQTTEAPEVYAQGAVLMDGKTGRVLWEKNMGEKLPMASTTKIMTCILALESGKLEEIVETSGTAAAAPKVKMGLARGEKHRNLNYYMQAPIPVLLWIFYIVLLLYKFYVIL